MDKITIYKLLAKIHDQIEDSILCTIKPNMKLYDLCLFIESQIKKHMEPLDYKEKGIAFPVGINVNDCAAHDSPFEFDSRVIQLDDIIKIDYGIHIHGYILDAAFTVCFKEEYRDLLETTRKACMEAANLFYPNTNISDISKKIKNIVGSKYEILKNLCGHQIQPYKIHSGKVVPNVIIPYNEKCLEGEIYTVEPYLTTNLKNKGDTLESNSKNIISHFMFNYHQKEIEKSMGFLKFIPTLSLYNTLAFHKRWLSQTDVRYLDSLVEKGFYKEYPPIYDKNKKAKIAQFETTILVTDKEPIILKNYSSIDKYILKVN